MNLKVKLLDQSVHELDVDPNVCWLFLCACTPAPGRRSDTKTVSVVQTLISDLRAVLEATLNIPADRQRLIYRGRVLRDENTLHELGGQKHLGQGACIACELLTGHIGPCSNFRQQDC